MRILNIVVAKTWGGGEQYVYDTAKAMRKRNIEVFIAIDKSNIEMQKRFSEVATVVSFELYSIAGLLSVFLLKDFITKYNINIINCHSGHAMLLCLLLKLLTNKRLVMFKHNALPIKNDWYHSWQREKTDAFVCVSELVYKMQTNTLSDLEKEKFHLVHNGIDIEKFEKGMLLSRTTNDDFVLGYAGRIAANKGIEVLLFSFKELVSKYPKMKLLIAGSDEKGYLAVVEKFIKDYNIESNVKYLGYISKMQDFYKKLNVFILPSVVKEAFGLVICEAMYSGVIVVTTDSGAQREIIDNGLNGYIVKNNDVSALSKCIEEIYLNYDKQDCIISAAQKKVNENFTIDSCVEKILNIYASLLRS